MKPYENDNIDNELITLNSLHSQSITCITSQAGSISSHSRSQHFLEKV